MKAVRLTAMGLAIGEGERRLRRSAWIHGEGVLPTKPAAVIPTDAGIHFETHRGSRLSPG
jgi:hypothetical protein